ncbi:hypothetical protein AFLA_005479 [Aspergillus flavus NRRL3357]|nr:hypothetical protein AFLA_005479 [Aspergillus flavus NRRL3357]
MKMKSGCPVLQLFVLQPHAISHSHSIPHSPSAPSFPLPLPNCPALSPGSAILTPFESVGLDVIRDCSHLVVLHSSILLHKATSYVYGFQRLCEPSGCPDCSRSTYQSASVSHIV